MSDPHDSEHDHADDSAHDFAHEHDGGVAEYVRLALMALVVARA
jgi:hypothetical protein